MSIYDQILSSVTSKTSIRVNFKGHDRDVCAHVIGRKNGHQQTLVFQYAGYSSSGLPAGGEWRCMAISDISSVEHLGGDWHTSDNHSKQQTCVDDVDAEVDY